jgi:hypothetical protein
MRVVSVSLRLILHSWSFWGMMPMQVEVALILLFLMVVSSIFT